MQVGNYSGAGHHLDSLLVLRIVVVFERHLVQYQRRRIIDVHLHRRGEMRAGV